MLFLLQTRQELWILSGIVETPHISDHCLVFAAFDLRMPKPPAAYVVARSYKYYDPQSFLSDLNKVLWCENILSDDVNEKLLHFYQAFFGVLDTHHGYKLLSLQQNVFSQQGTINFQYL